MWRQGVMGSSQTPQGRARSRWVIMIQPHHRAPLALKGMTGRRVADKRRAIKGENEKQSSPPTSSPMWPKQGRAVSRESLGTRGLHNQKCEYLHGRQE